VWISSATPGVIMAITGATRKTARKLAGMKFVQTELECTLWNLSLGNFTNDARATDAVAGACYCKLFRTRSQLRTVVASERSLGWVS
jgi:hypothetical protein